MGKRLIIFFASCGYLGYSPFVPGTVGSIPGIPLAIYLSTFDYLKAALIIAAIFAVSLWLASSAEKIIKEKDSPCIVCDEFAGFLVASYYVPPSPLNLFFIFLLFRIFDILKPFPANIINDRLEGGPGIVLDDIVAGLYTRGVFFFAMWFLGYR